MNYEELQTIIEEKNYEELKKSLSVSLINTEKNIDVIKTSPNEPFYDLSKLVYIKFNNNSYAIFNDTLLKMFDKTQEEVFKDALENMEKEYPIEITTPEEKFGLPILGDPMYYIFKNTEKFYGAASILYSNAIDKIKETIGDNCYIIPSSRHELLLIRKGGMEENAIREMIKDVNETTVSEKDFLSNNLYELENDEIKLV